MITNTYDLNLYIIDGQLKVLAHQLEFASDGHVQAGGEFVTALQFPVKRTNRILWEPILEFFGETVVYDELDSWFGVAMYDDDTPFLDWGAMGKVPNMPELMCTAVNQLPYYSMHDWR